MPIQWIQKFHCKSVEQGRQLNELELYINANDSEHISSMLIVPYPYVVSKGKDSLSYNCNLNTSIDTYPNSRELRRELYESEPELKIILNDLHNSYKHDEFGFMVVKVPTDTTIHLTWKHKLNYRSELFVPIKLSPAHLALKEKLCINTTIILENIVGADIPIYCKRKNIENGVHTFVIENTEDPIFVYGDLDYGFSTLNWDSSDDEECDSDDEDGRKEFLTKVGIY